MNSVNRRLACLFLPLAMLVTATCTRPFATPEFINPVTYDGIAKLARVSDVNMVWVHGMCSKRDDWPKNEHAILRRAMGARPVSQWVERSGKAYAAVFQDSLSGHMVESRYAVWSPISAPAKTGLKIGDLTDDPPDRARLNAYISDRFIADCVADAFVYSGATGDRIRSWVKSQICTAFEGQMHQGRCLLTAGDGRPVVVIGQSLGSRILLDAMQEIVDDNNATGRRDALDTRLSRDLQLIFLISNQIHLLRLTDKMNEGGTTKAQQSFFGYLQNARDRSADADQPVSDLQVIEISDPNDVLSLRFVPDKGNDGDLSVMNVMVSNSSTWFGTVANPVAVHEDYTKNKEVLKLLVDGHTVQ